jgi:hypothetical protein
MTLKPVKKWYTSFLLAPLALYFTFTRGHYTLIENIDLIIHEAGHFFFGFFGDFIQMAGGTLMQIIFPLFLAWYFYRNGYRTGVQIFIFWLGQNLINISVYAADANKMKLKLIGGRHDWLYLLNKLGLLNSADEVGYIFYAIAILVFIISIILPIYYNK